MGLLSKLGLKSANVGKYKTAVEEQLEKGDRILVEFGRTQAKVFIPIFDIPPNAQLFLNLNKFPVLDRRVVIPEVSESMYNDYLSWTDSVESTAESSSWFNIIVLAHTTKIIQDDGAHGKALGAMFAKAEHVGFRKQEMFGANEWMLLRLHVKANEPRDNPMRAVVAELLKRSRGLKAHLNIILNELEDMGIAYEDTCPDHHRGFVADEPDISERWTGTSDSEAEDEYIVVQHMSATVAVSEDEAKMEVKNQSVEYTEGDMKKALSKLGGLNDSKWAKPEEHTSVTHTQAKTAAVLPKQTDSAAMVEEKLGTAASIKGMQELACTPKKDLPSLPSSLQLPVIVSPISTIPGAKDKADPEYVAIFTPRREIPRTVPPSPKKSEKPQENSLAKQETAVRPHLKYMPNDKKDADAAQAKRLNVFALGRKSGENKRQFRYGNSVLTGLREKELHLRREKAMREPKGPSATAQEMKENPDRELMNFASMK